MMNVRWNPLVELPRVNRALDRFFDDARLGRPWLLHRIDAKAFPLDMYQTGTDVVVQGSLPGVRREDVEVSINGDTLTIKAEIKGEEEVREENYYRRERRNGSLQRTVSLPGGLATDKADATFDHGVLTIRIPKAEEARSKTIKVQDAREAGGDKA